MSDLTTAEWVRVKAEGGEVSILRSTYDFAPDAYDLLDKPATDAGNNPLPPKPKTTVSTEAAKKKAITSGRQAAANKEKKS